MERGKMLNFYIQFSVGMLFFATVMYLLQRENVCISIVAATALIVAISSLSRGFRYLFHDVWLGIGRWLEKIVRPITMAMVYFVIVTPFGAVMRIIQRDCLSIRSRKAGRDTCWIDVDVQSQNREHYRRMY